MGADVSESYAVVTDDGELQCCHVVTASFARHGLTLEAQARVLRWALDRVNCELFKQQPTNCSGGSASFGMGKR